MQGFLVRRAMTLIAVLLLSGALPAQREEIAGVTWDGWLVRVDPIDGSSVRVRPTGYFEFNGLAKDTQGRLFTIGKPFVGSRRLLQIDPYRGTATFFRFAFLNRPTGLAFSPDDVLYAVDTLGSVDSRLYRYDFTESAPDAHPLIVGRLTDVTEQSISIYGLAFSSEGVLYAWSTMRGLMKVDQTTGSCVDLNELDDGSSDIQSLAFSAGGGLYGVRSRLYAFDLGTGAYTRIGTGEGHDVRGAEFFPSPPPVPRSTRGPLGVPMPLSGRWLAPWFFENHHIR